MERSSGEDAPGNTAAHWKPFPLDVPNLLHNPAAQVHFFPIPSPSAFHTPNSASADLSLLGPEESSSYDASPHRWAQPNDRSMSLPASSPKNAKYLPPPKQIRFVSNDSQPHTKRRRINAACQTCRKRKTRCSGEKPYCKTCTDNGQACGGYADSQHPRKECTANGDDETQDESDNPTSNSPRRPPEHLDSTYDRRKPAISKSNTVELTASETSNPFLEGTTARAERDSPGSSYTANSMASAQNRVPYFRYFGPTAIVPGFKQMVVQMKDHRRSVNSISGESPGSNPITGITPSVSGGERPPVEIPFYDATDVGPISPMITHLCETFFTHLGCNYPFLQRERFIRDLEEKRVDAILVDAVCAVAARFSSHPLLCIPSTYDLPIDSDNEVQRAFRGQPFAQRAMAAVVETFPCPTQCVAQACLLLAYEEFGTDRDSGLWMYLGTSIRMAQDLGIQKLQGLQLEGRMGPTPKTSKSGLVGKDEELRREAYQRQLTDRMTTKPATSATIEDRRASEQERIDTFYCIFFLDRAVSSGVGRPVTLRDKDIEISFPHRPDDETVYGWPAPFPPLIRIVHLYGRAADVLNNIKDITQVTPEVLKKLAGMEKDLTGIYQRLSPKLHFNATNFQHYVKFGQGTNFILLHFWFHTLIVMLHQPTLLHSFQGDIQSLFPDSRELSMSSAKTIADILAFAELIDVKSFIGNPFTSQPMYIAACAFLAEAAAHASQPPSRERTPPDQVSARGVKLERVEHTESAPRTNPHLAAKHTLLATAANQNYQRCYKALKALEKYWAGTRYIITALDQKSKGIMDPLLFTSEDIDSEMPSTELNFTSPGWRRSASHNASLGASATSGPFNRLRGEGDASKEHLWTPKIDASQAIGWSLTGTTNSPAPNLSFLYQTTTGEGHRPTPLSPAPSVYTGYNMEVGREPIATSANRSRKPLQPLTRHRTADSVSLGQPTDRSVMPPPNSNYPPTVNDPVSNAEADLLLGLHSPYAVSASRPMASPHNSFIDSASSLQHNTVPPSSVTSYDYNQSTPGSSQYFAGDGMQIPGAPMLTPFGDVMIESQDVDVVNTQGGFAFPGGDMIPWLEYLPQDVLSYFGDAADDGSGSFHPSGPHPPVNNHSSSH